MFQVETFPLLPNPWMRMVVEVAPGRRSEDFGGVLDSLLPSHAVDGNQKSGDQSPVEVGLGKL